MAGAADDGRRAVEKRWKASGKATDSLQHGDGAVMDRAGDRAGSRPSGNKKRATQIESQVCLRVTWVTGTRAVTRPCGRAYKVHPAQYFHHPLSLCTRAQRQPRSRLLVSFSLSSSLLFSDAAAVLSWDHVFARQQAITPRRIPQRLLLAFVITPSDEHAGRRAAPQHVCQSREGERGQGTSPQPRPGARR